MESCMSWDVHKIAGENGVRAWWNIPLMGVLLWWLAILGRPPSTFARRAD